MTLGNARTKLCRRPFCDNRTAGEVTSPAPTSPRSGPYSGRRGWHVVAAPAGSTRTRAT